MIMKELIRNTSAALIVAMTAAAFSAHAQTSVTMFGSLSNFDVLNDTGQETYGFEIEIHGVNSIGGSFTYNRYGAPQVVPFSGGVYVRYIAPWDSTSGQFVTGTPPATDFTPTTGHQCVMGVLNYQNSGCEHFGVWTLTNPTQTIYRWLLADPNNPGQVIAAASPVAIPAPVWTVLPPAQPADPPIVAADVQAPVPPVAAEQFGDAQWMRVYKTENARQVGLDELVADNAVVPQDPAQVESAWTLVQAKLGGKGKRQQNRNQGNLGNGSHAVVRRYEFYKFTGTYDPATHEAICADGLCNAPADGEVGDFIGAQNAAANLNVPDQLTLNVIATGNGQVQGTPGSIKCPGSCTATVAPDTAFTLTAKPASGVIFAGWNGPCAGTQLTCTFNLDSSADLTATFLTTFNLSVSRNGKGTVSSAPAGIACGFGGGACSAKFAQSTAITLTATPDPTATWTGWTGACTGTSLSCSVTITKDTSVQANFR